MRNLNVLTYEHNIRYTEVTHEMNTDIKCVPDMN